MFYKIQLIYSTFFCGKKYGGGYKSMHDKKNLIVSGLFCFNFNYFNKYV